MSLSMSTATNVILLPRSAASRSHVGSSFAHGLHQSAPTVTTNHLPLKLFSLTGWPTGSVLPRERDRSAYRLDASADYRFTASSSSIHISMYFGVAIGPSYLRSLKNKVGVESTPAVSPCFSSLATCAAASS